MCQIPDTPLWYIFASAVLLVFFCVLVLVVYVVVLVLVFLVNLVLVLVSFRFSFKTGSKTEFLWVSISRQSLELSESQLQDWVRDQGYGLDRVRDRDSHYIQWGSLFNVSSRSCPGDPRRGAIYPVFYLFFDQMIFTQIISFLDQILL